MTQIAEVNVTSAEFKANPFPFYAHLRAEAPVYPIKLPSQKQPVWLVSRYDDVLALVKDERLVKNVNSAMSDEQIARQSWVPGFIKVVNNNMLSQDDPAHARLRGIVHKAFTPRLIDDMRGRIETISNDLLDRVEQTGQMDLIADFALPLPVTVISEMLGVPREEQQKFHVWSNAMVKSTAGNGLQLVKLLPVMWAFLRYVRHLIQVRQREPQDDLTTMLIQARDAGDQLSEDELVAMIFLLLIAGHETTVNLIGNGMLGLLKQRDQLEKLQANPVLIKPAVEELLRFGSPVEFADERYTREPITLYDVTIPKGALVYGVLASANRDENYFTDPDRIDIMREPNRHLAFGQGIHYCLGAPLARLEGQIAFNALLKRLPNIELTNTVEHWRPGLMLRGLETLPVRF